MNRPNRYRGRVSRRRAVILVLTLWIVLVLALMAQSLVFEMRVEMKLTGSNRDQLVAEQLARIGVARAVADLRNDFLADIYRQELERRVVVDTLADYWAGDGRGPSEETEVKTSGERNPVGFYRTMVVDEESKIDLNGYGGNWVQLMTNLLQVLDLEEKEARSIAQAIWDWKDADDLPLGGKGASERTFYAGGSARGSTRRSRDDAEGLFYPKNAPFDTVDELLQIPGMTPELFYGYDPEKTPDPEFFPNRSGGEREERRPGLRDLVTVRTNSLNLNTVGFECLTALCAFATDDLDNKTDDLDSGATLAKRIIEAREGKEVRKAGDEDGAFRSLNDFEKHVEGLSTHLLAKMNQVERLTTQSSFFTIYSEGRTGGQIQRFRSSSRDSRVGRAATRARIVAECQRSGITASQEELEGILPAEALKKIADSNLGHFNIFANRFCLPAIHFKRWISY